MAPSTKDMRRADLSECCDSPALSAAIGWGARFDRYAHPRAMRGEQRKLTL